MMWKNLHLLYRHSNVRRRKTVSHLDMQNNKAALYNTDIKLSSLGIFYTGVIRIHHPTPAQSKSEEYFKWQLKDYVPV